MDINGTIFYLKMFFKKFQDVRIGFPAKNKKQKTSVAFPSIPKE